MTTVRELVVGAYNSSTLNNAGKLALDAELVSQTDRMYQQLWPLIARARPDQYGATTTLTLSGVPPVASLPTGLIDLQGVTDADDGIVNVIPTTDLQRSWNLPPAVTRIGQTLRSRANTGDPSSGDVLTVLYLDQPAALTTMDSVLDTRWPSRHNQLLVDALAMYLATKDAGRSAGDRQGTASALQRSVAAFGSEYAVAPSNLGWIHADASRTTE